MNPGLCTLQEVWTRCGLVTDSVLFFIHLASRRVHVAGVTPHPDQGWMGQMARNVTMAEWGSLSPGEYLIHDRDGRFCPAFQRTVDAVGVRRVVLPPRSPDLNAYAERWVRSVKEECLSRLILFGERALWHALTQYEEHYHRERHHQGKGNVLLIPPAHLGRAPSRVERWRAHGSVRWLNRGFRRGPQSGSHGDVSSAPPKSRVEDWRGTEGPVSSPRHIKPGVLVSSTGLSCSLRAMVG